MFIDDMTRVRHMVEAADEAISFVQGLELADLYTDRKLALALVKCLEIVGEAAYKISRDYKDTHPEIEWRALVELRNHLIHEYHSIDNERIWDALREDIPGTLPALRQLFAEGQA
jgi:uncharacterized protein with HEPN domain